MTSTSFAQPVEGKRGYFKDSTDRISHRPPEPHQEMCFPVLGRTVSDSGNGDGPPKLLPRPMVGIFHISSRAPRSAGWKGLQETRNVLNFWVERSARDGRPVTATSLLPPPSTQPTVCNSHQIPNHTTKPHSQTTQPNHIIKEQKQTTQLNHTAKPPTTQFCSSTFLLFSSLTKHPASPLNRQPTN